MHAFILFLSGGLIALMLAVNGQLSQAVSLAPTLILIHLSGLLASLLLLPIDKPQPAKKVPLYLYSAGLIGVGLTFADLACVTALGVTMTLAIKLMGQLVGAFLLDLTGLTGSRRSVSRRSQGLTLLIAALGCLMMLDLKALSGWFIWLAFGSGMLQSLTALLNAELGSRIGNFKSVSFNFLTGLLGSLPLLLFSAAAPTELLTAMSSLPFYLLAGGGLLAVLVVSSRTLCFKHVSMLNATLLLLMGQLGFGSLLDLYLGLTLRPTLLAGGLVMLLGLMAGQLRPALRLGLRQQKV